MVRNQGYTLMEVLLTVAIIAVVATATLSVIGGARISADEVAAMATLNTIKEAQIQAVAMALVDQDTDGVGEYSFLGDLAGKTLLPSSFATLIGGAHNSHGYYFQVFLPDQSGAGVPEGQPTDAVDPDGAEMSFCAFAWPASAGKTGNRAFFICESTGVLVMENMAPVGSRPKGKSTPVPEDAYPDTVMKSFSVVGAHTSSSGLTWRPAF